MRNGCVSVVDIAITLTLRENTAVDAVQIGRQSSYFGGNILEAMFLSFIGNYSICLHRNVSVKNALLHLIPAYK